MGTTKQCLNLTSRLFKLFKPQLTNQYLRNMCQNQEDVILESTSNIGVILLNRPQHLNALNISMVNKILAALNAWSETKSLIICRALGGRAFCAGGDVKKIAEAAYVGDYNVGDEFFYREYKMNATIGKLAIPYITFMDGITMGGGVGLSVHSPYRVATENTLFAMPETKIGFFPDVGGSHFLPKLGFLGLFLGLTGQRLKGPDVFHAGVATHYVESKYLPKLEQRLLECSGHSDVKKTLDSFHKQTPYQKFSLKDHLGMIDAVFSLPTIEEMCKKLESEVRYNEWNECVLKMLKEMSPTSLKVTKRAFYEGRKLNLSQALEMEFRIATYAIRQHDFYEGIRALLISKDKNPKWDPPRLEEVTQTIIDPFFEKCVCTKYKSLL